ncbi:MAG: hypothetical protein GY826_27145, partial [Fuerstiella sp.]|nr:hypothetical protein [Fuerstiella sp.]
LSLTSLDGDTYEFVHAKYPEQKMDISFGFPVTPDGYEGELPDFLAYPTPGRRNTEPHTGTLSAIELSQPHGLFRSPFTLTVKIAEPDVIVRYTTDGSRPDESSPVLEQPLNVAHTTIIRVRGYRSGCSPTPVVTRSYIFPADRIDDSANGLPPENYPYDWGAGKSNYGLDAGITRDPEQRAKLLDALWAIPSYSLSIESENLFSDETGIYAHAG